MPETRFCPIPPDSPEYKFGLSSAQIAILSEDPMSELRFRPCPVNSPEYPNAISAAAITVQGGVPDTTPPTPVVSLHAIPASSTEIDLDWSASSDNVSDIPIALYRIERLYVDDPSIPTDVDGRLTGLTIEPRTLSGSANGVACRLGGGGLCTALRVIGTISGSAVTIATKIQESDDGATGWSDIPSATFTVAVTSFRNETIHFTSTKQYVRAVVTIGGSGVGVPISILLSKTPLSYAEVGTSIVTNFVDTVGGTGTYSYRVRAQDAAGNRGAYSADVQAFAADAPTNVSLFDNGPDVTLQSIEIDWDDIDTSSGVIFSVERSYDGGAFASITEIAVGTGGGVGSRQSTIDNHADHPAGTLPIDPLVNLAYRVRLADQSGNLGPPSLQAIRYNQIFLEGASGTLDRPIDPSNVVYGIFWAVSRGGNGDGVTNGGGGGAFEVFSHAYTHGGIPSYLYDLSGGDVTVSGGAKINVSAAVGSTPGNPSGGAAEIANAGGTGNDANGAGAGGPLDVGQESGDGGLGNGGFGPHPPWGNGGVGASSNGGLYGGGGGKSGTGGPSVLVASWFIVNQP